MAVPPAAPQVLLLSSSLPALTSLQGCCFVSLRRSGWIAFMCVQAVIDMCHAYQTSSLQCPTISLVIVKSNYPALSTRTLFHQVVSRFPVLMLQHSKYTSATCRHCFVSRVSN